MISVYLIDKDAYGSIDGAATLKQALDTLQAVKPVEDIPVAEEEPIQSMDI